MLDLPVRVLCGKVKQIIVEIPWSRILTDPVKVKVNGVEVRSLSPRSSTSFFHLCLPSHEQLEVTLQNGAHPAPKSSNVRAQTKKGGYLSILRDRILENLQIEVDHVRIAITDTKGSFPATFWLVIRRLIMNSPPDSSSDTVQLSPECNQCPETFPTWLNLNNLASQSGEVRKCLEVCGFDLYIEEAGEQSASLPTLDEFWSWQRRMSSHLHAHAVVSDATMKVTFSLVWHPIRILHSCVVEGPNPIDIQLKDTDIRVFLSLIDQLRLLVSRSSSESVPTEQTEINDDDAEFLEETEQNGGLFSWIHSTWSGYGTWLGGTSNNQDDYSSGEDEDFSMETSETQELTKEERDNLNLLQEERITSSNTKALSTNVQISLSGIRLTLIQHDEIFDIGTGQCFVVPRPLIRIVSESVHLQMSYHFPGTRLHASCGSLYVEDLSCSETSLFPEIIQIPRSNFVRDSSASKVPIHLSFCAGFQGSHSSIDLTSPSILIAIPASVLTRLVSFVKCVIQLPHAHASTSAPSSPVKVSLVPSWGLSIRFEQIHLIQCANFQEKNTELLVVELESLSVEKRNIPEVLRRFDILVPHLAVYSATLPTYLCNSTQERFYFLQPLEFGVAIRQIPSLLSLSDIPQHFYQIECSISNAQLFFVASKLKLLSSIAKQFKNPLREQNSVIRKEKIIHSPNPPHNRNWHSLNLNLEPETATFQNAPSSRVAFQLLINSASFSFLSERQHLRFLTAACLYVGELRAKLEMNRGGTDLEFSAEEARVEDTTGFVWMRLTSSPLRVPLLDSEHSFSAAPEDVHFATPLSKLPSMRVPKDSDPLTPLQANRPGMSPTPAPQSKQTIYISAHLTEDLVGPSLKMNLCNLDCIYKHNALCAILSALPQIPPRKRQGRSLQTMSKELLMWHWAVAHILEDRRNSLIASARQGITALYFSSREDWLNSLLTEKNFKSSSYRFTLKDITEHLSRLPSALQISAEQIRLSYLEDPPSSDQNQWEILIPSIKCCSRPSDQSSSLFNQTSISVQIDVSTLSTTLTKKGRSVDPEILGANSDASSEDERSELSIGPTPLGFSTQNLSQPLLKMKRCRVQLTWDSNHSRGKPSLIGNVKLKNFLTDVSVLQWNDVKRLRELIAASKWPERSSPLQESGKGNGSCFHINVTVMSAKVRLRDAEKKPISLLTFENLSLGADRSHDGEGRLDLNVILSGVELLSFAATTPVQIIYQTKEEICALRASVLRKEQKQSENWVIHVSGSISGYQFRWDPLFGQQLQQFVSPANLHQKESLEVPQKHLEVFVEEIMCSDISVALGSAESVSIHIFFGKIFAKSSRPLGDESSHAHVALESVTLSVKDFITTQSQIVFRTQLLEAEITNSPSSLAISFRCEGLGVDMSSFILDCIKRTIASFSRPNKANLSSSRPQDEHKKEVKFEFLFDSSHLYFCREEVRHVDIFFERFQILRGTLTDNLCPWSFLSFAFTKSTASHRQDGTLPWRSVLVGNTFSRKLAKSSLPGLCDNAVGYYAKLWRTDGSSSKTRIYFGELEAQIKPLLASLVQLRQIISRTPSHPKESQSIQPHVPTSYFLHDWDVNIGKISGTFRLDSLKEKSVLTLHIQSVSFQTHAQISGSSISNSAVGYASIELSQLAGNDTARLWSIYNCTISQFPPSRGYIRSVEVECDVFEVTLPLSVIPLLQYYALDIVQLNKTLRKPPIRSNRLCTFNGELLNSPESVIQAKLSSICFDHASSALRFNAGYSWKGSSAKERTKTVIWSAGEGLIRIRRLSWTNEGGSPRTSAVILQCHCDENGWIDVLAPIEANCALNHVDTLIASRVSAKTWRLVFPCPDSEQEGFNWPFISNFQILVDNEQESLQNSAVNDGFNGSLQTKIKIGNSTVALHSDTQRLSSLLFQADYQLLEANLMCFRPSLESPMHFDGYLETLLQLKYQDYALLAIKPLLTAHPRIHINSDCIGCLSFSVWDSPDNPTELRLTRPVLQLARNVIDYLQHTAITLAKGLPMEIDKLGMFFHYRFVNHTGITLKVSEIRKELVQETNRELLPMESTYWKWGLTCEEPFSRRILLQSASFASIPLDLSQLGIQRITLVSSDGGILTILLRISYPEARSCSASKTLEVEFLGEWKVSNFLPFPVSIEVPTPFQSPLTVDCPKIKTGLPQQRFFCSWGSSESKQIHFKIRSQGSPDCQLSLDLLSLRKYGVSSPSLICVRQLGELHQQYAWVNFEREKLEGGYEQLHLLLSSPFCLINQTSLSLRWRVEYSVGILGEGIIQEREELPLFFSPRRKCFLRICSSHLNQESSIWSAPYEITRIQPPWVVQMESGIGQLSHDGFQSPMQLQLSFYSKTNNMNQRSITLVAPLILRNETSEGLFIAQLLLSQDRKPKFQQQLYLPPGAIAPFGCSSDLPKTSTSLCVFAFSARSSAPTSLRAVASPLADWNMAMGIDPTSVCGDYLIGYREIIPNLEGKSVYSHNYLARLSDDQVLGQRTIRLLAPFMLRNETSHALAIDSIWTSNMDLTADEGNRMPQGTSPNHSTILVPPKSSHLIHHWTHSVEDQPSRRYGLGLGMLARYEGIGWMDILLVNLNKSASSHEVHNNLTFQLDRIQVSLIPKVEENYQGQFEVLVKPGDPFPYWIVNYTRYPFRCRFSHLSEEIDLHPGISCPISEHPKLEDGLLMSLQMAHHRWTDNILIQRPRHFLFALYGPMGSISLQASIQFVRGSAFLYLREASHLLEGKLDKFRSTNEIVDQRELSKMHLKDSNKETIFRELIGSSQKHLSNQFLVAPGLIGGLKLSHTFITFLGEDGTSLLRCDLKGLGTSVSRLLRRNERIQMRIQLESLLVHNSLADSHVPVRWGCAEDQAEESAFQLSVDLPAPFLGHLSRLSVKSAPLYLNLTGPFVSLLLQLAPAWISAIQHPTQSHGTLRTRKEETSNAKVFLDQFEVALGMVEVTWLNSSSSLQSQLPLPSQFLSVSNLRLRFSAVRHIGCPINVAQAVRQCVLTWRRDLLWRLFPTLGSFDLLGNPTHLVRQMKHYLREYSELIRWSDGSVEESTMDGTQFGLARNSESLGFAILAALVDCTISFNGALKDAMALVSRDALALSEKAPELLGESQSDQLRHFLQTARASLEEAMRDSLSLPMQGFRSNGVFGLLVGTKEALIGWTAPCLAGLDGAQKVLLLLRRWLMSKNTFKPLPASNTFQSTLLSAEELIRPLNLLELPSDAFSALIGPDLKAKVIFSCRVNVWTEQYGTLLQHSRSLVLFSDSVTLLSSNSVSLEVLLHQLDQIAHENEELLTLSWHGCTQLLQLSFFHLAERAEFVAHLQRLYYGSTGFVLVHPRACRSYDEPHYDLLDE